MTEQEAILDAKQECISFGKMVQHTVYWTTVLPQPLITTMDWVTELSLDLNEEDVVHYCVTLCKYLSVFQEAVVHTTTCSIMHNILLTTDRAIWTKPYPYSDKE